MRTIHATIDETGSVKLLESVRIKGTHRALVTIYEDDADTADNDSARLSEPALQDWHRPEEDAAWSHLQPGRSS